MRISRWWFVPMGALMLTLGSCESSDNVTWISESDNDKIINAGKGDTLKIKIWGNPTTGYTWNSQALTTNVLMETSMDYEADSEAPGSGGYYYFCYKAEQTGTAVVYLVYSQVFEPAEPPAKTFQVMIAID